MSIRIIVDSTVDMADELKLSVSVVPMTVRFGDEEFIDGVNLTHYRFYEKLIESDTMPTTSQATPEEFLKVLRPIVECGDEAIVITLSSKLSGTYQSALIAASELERKVYVVDSKSVTVGSGILVERAIQMVKSGDYSAEEIADKLHVEAKKIKVIALLDTLEYLKRGGRISKTVAFAGGLLSIKPVVSLCDGEIQMLGKARGSKQGNNLLKEEIEKAGGIDFDKPVLLGYTGLSDILLQKYINDSKDIWSAGMTEPRVSDIGSVVGTHAGPGAIAAAFFAKEI